MSADPNAIHIGTNSGEIGQVPFAVAIGKNAGQFNQQTNSIALGKNAGQQNQSGYAIAIGNNAGQISQSTDAISIGLNAGQTNQSSYCVAIGPSSGQLNQGINAVAIGYHAGKNNQSANSIVLNASATPLNSNTQGFFVNPLRQSSSIHPVFYNSASSEFTFSTSTLADKTNVIDLPIEQSSSLYALEPRQYTYKADGTTNVGFIAEQVGEVDSKLVVVDANNKPINIKWTDLTTYLVAELQKHQKMLDTLTALIQPQCTTQQSVQDALTQSNTQLQAVVSQLETQKQTIEDLNTQLQTQGVELQNITTQFHNLVSNTHNITTSPVSPISSLITQPRVASLGKISFGNLLHKSPYAL